MAEGAFPRGGGSGLEPFEHKKLHRDAFEKAKADVLGRSAGQRGGRRPGQDTRRPRKGEDNEEGSLFDAIARIDDGPRIAPILSFSALRVGAKVWAAVIEVSTRGLVLSLPHGLTGRVPAAVLAEMGLERDAIPSVFRIGQLVRAVVTEVVGQDDDGMGVPSTADELEGGQQERDNKKKRKKKTKAGSDARQRKRVTLSVSPAQVNAGLDAASMAGRLPLAASVQSVEDHGAVLSVGIPGVAAFLPKAAYPTRPGDRPLVPGELLDVAVAMARAGGRVTVDARPEALAPAAGEWPGMHLGGLLPGLLVSATVLKVLSNGLSLSFLTFFTGTVDALHLAGKQGKMNYSAGQRVSARILYVDAGTKTVLLSLRKGLVEGRLPDNFPMMGQIFPEAEVVDTTRGLGVLCTLPSPSGHIRYPRGVVPPSETGRSSMAKAFPPGTKVKARVIGFRPLDALAVLSLREEVVESSVLSLADVAPGDVVKGAVVEVIDAGLVVSVGQHVRGLVPTLHATDTGTRRGLGKFKVGQVLSGLRALVVDPANRKLLLTLKPSLLASKLPRIARAEDAVPGTRSHGVVTGVGPKAVFVTFYGNMAGRVSRKEAGALADGQTDLGEVFKPGQVVRARVLGFDRDGHGLRLSLATAASEEPEAKKKESSKTKKSDGGRALPPPKAGEFAWARVRRVVQAASGSTGQLVYVDLRSAEHADSPLVGGGRLEVRHLADHPAAAAALAETLREGLDLGRVLVLRELDRPNPGRGAGAEAPRQTLVVTRKPALVRAAERGELPLSLQGLTRGALLLGYVVSLAKDAAYVRFLGSFTARCPLKAPKAEEDGDEEAAAATAPATTATPATTTTPPPLTVGQTVRVRVTFVDEEKERLGIALARVPGDAAQNAADLFACDLLAARWAEEPSKLDWAGAIVPGKTVAGAVSGVKEYGTLCDLDVDPDIIGIAAPNQAGAVAGVGTRLRAAVLDYSAAEGVVDLSLLPRLVGAQSKKRARPQDSAADLEPGSQLVALVELVKRDAGYCVVSFPPDGEARGVGILALDDYNASGAGAREGAAASGAAVFPEIGETVAVVVERLPTPEAPRLLLLRKGAAPGAAKRPRLADGVPKPGSTVEAVVVTVDALRAELELPGGRAARLCVAEAAPGGPLGALCVGETVRAAVLGGGRDGKPVELTTRPEALLGDEDGARQGPHGRAAAAVEWKDLAVGQKLCGFVEEASAAKGVWCVFSASVRGLAPPALAAETPGEVERLASAFVPGQPIEATVVRVDAAGGRLDLNLTPRRFPPKSGDLVLGRLAAPLLQRGEVHVELGAKLHGSVALPDLHDALVKDAVAGLAPGQWVLARVIEGGPGGKKDDKALVRLSLRPNSGGVCQSHASGEPATAADAGALGTLPAAPVGREKAAGSLKVGDVVSGYVRGAGPAGVFVALNRSLTGRLRLRALAREGPLAKGRKIDGPAVERAFPLGRLVVARIIEVSADGRLELSQLKPRDRQTPKEKAAEALKDLELGDAVWAEVTQVKDFGLVLRLEHGVTGMAKKRELADKFVKDAGAMFSPGQRVRARVLGIDTKKQRALLGLKPSYFRGDLAEAMDMDVDVAGEEEAEGLAELEEESDFEDELEDFMKPAKGGVESDGFDLDDELAGDD